jgi:hypothetical protein
VWRAGVQHGPRAGKGRARGSRVILEVEGASRRYRGEEIEETEIHRGGRDAEEDRMPRRDTEEEARRKRYRRLREVMLKDDTDEYSLICITRPQGMVSAISTNASRETSSQAPLRCKHLADALTQRSAKDGRSTVPSHSPHSAPTTCPVSPPHKPSCTRRASSRRTRCAEASCGRTRPTRVSTRWRFPRGVGVRVRVRGLPRPSRADPLTGWVGN